MSETVKLNPGAFNRGVDDTLTLRPLRKIAHNLLTRSGACSKKPSPKGRNAAESIVDQNGHKKVG